jgi:NACalpha-BTF3-like transcription factor
MKKKIKKLLKRGIITENELDLFIKILVKLSKHRVLSNKPKKVIEKLTPKKQIISESIDSQDVIHEVSVEENFV